MRLADTRWIGLVSAIVFTGFTSVSGLAGWDKLVTEVQDVYLEYSDKFRLMSDMLLASDEIKAVSPVWRPEKDANIMPKYADFSKHAIKEYYEILGMMEEIGVERIFVERFPLSRLPDRIISFVMASSDLGPAATGIAINRFWGDGPEHFALPSQKCKELVHPEWYICYSE